MVGSSQSSSPLPIQIGLFLLFLFTDTAAGEARLFGPSSPIFLKKIVRKNLVAFSKNTRRKPSTCTNLCRHYTTTTFPTAMQSINRTRGTEWHRVGTSGRNGEKWWKWWKIIE
jgi:hypothetical protein